MAVSPDSESEAPHTVHVPVLSEDVLHFLDLGPGLRVVDGTVGSGGHAVEIAARIQPEGRLIGLDRDPAAIARARRRLPADCCALRQASFSELSAVLAEFGLTDVDRVLLDLGLSSDQLADRDRGFSFDSEGELDMRFDPASPATASEIINRTPEAELADLFYEYGEERLSRRIARRVVQSRPIETARELAEIVARCYPRGRHRIHPATRVFQALRIAVNEELDHLRRFLHEELPRCLASGGRAVVISFHSLEDRLVKQAFRDRDTWLVLTKKPVTAGAAETARNPRSRSAKLRAAQRL